VKKAGGNAGFFVGRVRAAWSLFRFDGIETGLQIPDLTRFLDANR
jgi:hypothetical protein